MPQFPLFVNRTGFREKWLLRENLLLQMFDLRNCLILWQFNLPSIVRENPPNVFQIVNTVYSLFRFHLFQWCSYTDLRKNSRHAEKSVKRDLSKTESA